MEQLDELRVDIELLEDDVSSASSQVQSTCAKLDTLIHFRDTEHNCRYLKSKAANFLCMWISCNHTTYTRGRLVFSCNLTGIDDSVPFSKIKFVPSLTLIRYLVDWSVRVMP